MQYRTPGVYIEEISIFPPSVAQVETAIPVFIGYTNRAQEKVANDLLNVPKRITSVLEYTTFFGGGENETGITVAVTGGVAVASISDPSPHNMYYSIQAFYANGGGPCYIISVGQTGSGVSLSALQAGLTEAQNVDEITLLVFPEARALVDETILITAIGSDPNIADPGTTLAAYSDYGTLFNDALAQCELLKDRFVVMDALLDLEGLSIFQCSAAFRGGGVGINDLKYGAVYGPFMETVFDYQYSEANVQVSIDGGSAVTMNSMNPNEVVNAPNGDLYPAVQRAVNAIPITLPASPLVVGVYAAVDSTRGVWKAPANVSLTGVVKPTIAISHDEQEDLNVTTTGKSINAIRAFTGKGILIWGARTLAGNDNEWRYVPVRRFFNMAEESIKKATEAFVFEPNDANTWTQVQSMIENFLTIQWRAGALQGAKPEQAFFVKVGLGVTMSPLDILEGRMIVEIGMAVVRPAEFIILKFSHKLAEA